MCNYRASSLYQNELDGVCALKDLTLESCHALEDLPIGLRNLKSLRTLCIRHCHLLESLPLDLLEGLTSLRELCIGYCELASLSEGIQYLTSSERLFIWRCPLLNHLPESMQSLNALWWLEIRDCINLMCLPDSVRHLGSLKRLHIMGCPHLVQSCQEERGEEWPKIAHIPIIQIKGKEIKSTVH